MKKNAILFLACLASFMALPLSAQHISSQVKEQTATQNAAPVETSPPSMITAKAGIRWWSGLSEGRTALQHCIDEYAKVGIGAVELMPVDNVQGRGGKFSFLSPQWMEALRDVRAMADKHHIQVDVNSGAGLPPMDAMRGGAGQPEVVLEATACKLILLDTVVTTKVAKDLVLEVGEEEKPYAKLLVQRDFPVNKRDYRRVIALYQSPTRQRAEHAVPGSGGYAVDVFDAAAVAHSIERLERAFSQTGTAHPGTIAIDYGLKGADWTPTLLDEFHRRRGYRIENHLPALANGNAKVLTDYRQTMSELLYENYTRQWTQWCHSHGALVRNQMQGAPGNLIDMYAAVDVPETGGAPLMDFGIKGLQTFEGMARESGGSLARLKYASSAAHITGKRLTSSQAFSGVANPYAIPLSQMKPNIDLLFCAGVNRIFFQGASSGHQDEPWPQGQVPEGIDLSPGNPLWRDAPHLMKYVERCQNYLQWGNPDNDFLVYLPVGNLWAQNTPRLLMATDEQIADPKASDFIRALLAIDSLGYDCDFTSDSQLLATQFDGHRLRTAAGTTYKALVVPGDCTMPPEVRHHIDRLEQGGAHVIRGWEQTDMARAAQPEAMKAELHLHLIRRSNPSGHHYFMANLTQTDIDEWVMPAVECKDALWYDPMTGETLAVETQDKWLKVRLRSGQSMVLQTFDRLQPQITELMGKQQLKPRSALPNLTEGNCIELKRGWKLRFEDSEPAVKKTFKPGHLRTWETLDKSTRSLMGTGIYENTFEVNRFQLNGSHTWQIDLGDVRESARVSINGHYVGCAWAVPFVLWFDKSVLVEGRNTVSIAVTNLAANRIHELKSPSNAPQKGKANATLPTDWRPLASGLNGPVRIIRVE